MYSSLNKSAVVVVCLTFCFLAAAYSQEPVEKSDSSSQGVALYERGDTEGAVKSLREAVKTSKQDPRAWHYLGLALIRQGKSKEATQALGKAIGLRTEALSRDFKRNEEWRDDRLLNLKTLLGDQIESQSKLLEILSDKQALEKGELELGTLQVQADCVAQNTNVGVDGRAVLRKSDLKIERPKILFKTEPAFPVGAPQGSVNATVILRAVFVRDGSIKLLETIQSSGDMFAQEAVKAANLTRFRPASFCGKPISYTTQLEYSFTRF